MIVFPNAKINLGLHIVSRRADGYHNLETVFYPIKTCTDALEILQSDEDFLEILGKPILGNWRENLIWKAVLLLRQDFEQLKVPLHIILHKKIPMGAGMGGGSADASFVLMALQRKFNLQISQNKMAEYALRLGSDCPFFLQNSPAFAAGRGERLETISVNLDDYSIQIVCTPMHISTAKAFQGINVGKAPFDLKKLNESDIMNWKEYLFNDFEKTIFKQHPILADIKQDLYQQGALYASLTGTGSAVYGIFRKNEQAAITHLPPGTEVFYQL